MGAILTDCGADEKQVLTFCAKCNEQFGDGAALSPANLIQGSRFQVRTDEVTISVPPDQSYLVEARMIDGKRYLLVPVSDELEVNGMGVDWKTSDSEG